MKYSCVERLFIELIMFVLLSDLVCCAGSQANLHALIQLKPALSHLGDKGLLLLLRLVFTTTLVTRHGLKFMIRFSLLCSPAS